MPWYNPDMQNENRASQLIPNPYSRYIGLALLAAAILLASGCRRDAQVQPEATEPDPAPSPEVVFDDEGLLAALRQSPPARDPVDLALRFGRIKAKPDIDALEARPAPELDLGTNETFFLHDISAQKYFEIEAELKVKTDIAYFWVQQDQSVDLAKLEKGAADFTKLVYPKVRESFGHEWNPGIDGDPRLHVLHHQPVPGIAGYFYSVDEYPRSVEPKSNEREMFYINLSVYSPGSNAYLSLLAHEFQHMIHWRADRNESVWANEGLSELSSQLAGFRTQEGTSFFLSPDTPLMEWNPDPGANGPHYAGSYAFMTYLYERFGEDFLREFVSAEPNGAAGIEAVVQSMGLEASEEGPLSFDSIFLDWVAANGIPEGLSNRPALSYGETNVARAGAETAEFDRDLEVSQYGTDYLDVSAMAEGGELDISFDGQAEVDLLDSERRGEAFFWAGRGDNIDSKLTRSLDLKSLSEPRLDFELWYEIEEFWDYGYFAVSEDDGERWTALASENTSEENRNGNAFGPGLTGDSEGWIAQSLDLSAYAGKRISIRFEMVTDDAVNLGGMAIAAPRLMDGGRTVELFDTGSDDGAWVLDGWQRVPSRVPQRWGLQVILLQGRKYDRKIYRADDQGQANIALKGVPADAKVVLAVSGLTPATRQKAGYRLRGLP